QRGYLSLRRRRRNEGARTNCSFAAGLEPEEWDEVPLPCAGRNRVRGARHYMSGRLQELERKAKDIRHCVLDVYYDVDPPIGPLLDAYDNAVAELVQEERRSRRTKIAK